MISVYSPPGNERDAPEGSSFYGAWHEFVRSTFQHPFADQTRELGAPVGEAHVVWTALSRKVFINPEGARDDPTRLLRTGDSRLNQMEYVEWHVTYDRGRISKVTFSTEVPEYWSILAREEPEIVLALYRSLVGPEVRREDLFPEGEYDPQNVWNVRHGIVHLAYHTSTLVAARGQLSIFANEAIAPTNDNFSVVGYGDTHASDARIQLDVKGVRRLGLRVAPKDPVGIYIAGWDDSGFTKPDGHPVGDYFRIVRGQPGAALRVEYQVPEEEGFLVGDILIGGRRIESGGQLAEQLTVVTSVSAFAER